MNQRLLDLCRVARYRYIYNAFLFGVAIVVLFPYHFMIWKEDDAGYTE